MDFALTGYLWLLVLEETEGGKGGEGGSKERTVVVRDDGELGQDNNRKVM